MFVTKIYGLKHIYIVFPYNICLDKEKTSYKTRT